MFLGGRSAWRFGGDPRPDPGGPLLVGGDPPREGFPSCGFFPVVSEPRMWSEGGKLWGRFPVVGETKGLRVHKEDIPGVLSTF